MLKTKKLNKRFLSAVLGFAFAFAPVPYIFSCNSLTVSADFGELAGLTDFVESAYSAAPSGAWNVTGYAAYVAALWAIDTALNNPLVTGSSVNASDVTVFTGQYIYNGELYPVTISGLNGQYYSRADRISFIKSPHFDISINVTADASGQSAPDLQVSNSWGGSTAYTSFYYTGHDSTPTAFYYIIENSGSIFTSTSVINWGGFSYLDLRTSITGNPPTFVDNTPVSSVILRNSGYGKIGGNLVVPSLPSSSAGLNADYILNVLNPYYISTYPSIEPYIFTPYVPEYPTDFVTGIPKEWTVENPQLPTAADLEFEHYEEDLTGFHPIQEIKETVDIIKAMDFWWWLTEKTLDSLNLKIFYVIFLTVGVLIFIVWIIGQ